MAFQIVFSAAAFADYDRALELYLKEDYIQAAIKFDRMIASSSSHPKISYAVYYSALCRLKLEQPKPAVERLQSLLSTYTETEPDQEKAPPQAVVRLALGVAYRMLGDETTALSYFESSWLSSANTFERAAAREKIKEHRSMSTGAKEAPPSAVSVVREPDPPSRPPAPSSKSSNQAWAVQVASAADFSEIEAIYSRLRQDGWPVYRESTNIRGTAYDRIRLGPYPSESEAIAARGRLQTKLGIEGWVTRK